MVKKEHLIYLCLIILAVAWTVFYGIERFNRGFLPNFQFFSSPVLNNGDKFMLKTDDDQYVAVCKTCKPMDQNINNLCSSLLCLVRYPVKSSVFTYHSFRDGRVALETNDYYFWKHCDTCVHECKGAVCADGINKNLPTHKWYIIKHPDQTITIKSNTGRVIQRCNCGQSCGRILCTMGLAGFEKFKVEKVISMPPEPQELKFKPKRGRSSVFDGVSLSMIQ